MSAEPNKLSRIQPLIRIGWSNSEKELFAYVFRPSKSNYCEVAVEEKGETLKGPLAAETIPMLLSLAKKAHEEVKAIKPSKTANQPQMWRLVVDYTSDGRKTFTLHAPLPELFQIFDRAPALRQLLKLASANQAKNYRIIDDPGPAKDMGKAISKAL